MFEAGFLGTLEDIGFSIRNSAFIATHPEVWDCNLRSTGKEYRRDVKSVKTNETTAKLLKEKKIQLDFNEDLTEEMREQILSFLASMAECTDDFLEKMNMYESEEELYEYPELDHPEEEDYGSCEYDYPTKAKAKVACKVAVQAMMDTVKKDYEEQKESLLSGVRKCYWGFEKSFDAFLTEFLESYDDYVSVECEAAKYLMARKAEIFKKEFLEKETGQYNLKSRFSALAGERFGTPGTKIFDVKKYFLLCEYNENEDGYCYRMEEACDRIYQEASDFLMTEAEDFPKDMFHVYQETVSSYCEILKNRLAKL